jgi:hypothetical protein
MFNLLYTDWISKPSQKKFHTITLAGLPNPHLCGLLLAVLYVRSSLVIFQGTAGRNLKLPPPHPLNIQIT